MLNKYKLNRNKDLNIVLNLSTKVDLESDDGKLLLEDETTSSINLIVGGDKFRIKKSGNTSINMKFYNGSTFVSDLSGAGFTTNELTTVGDNVFSSFFFFRVYDSENLAKANLLHTSYINGYQLYGQNGTSTIFSLDGSLEYNNLYVLERLKSVNIAYVKFNFYNAKTGVIHNFISDDTNTELVEINLANNEYNFTNSSLVFSENTNVTYNTIINSSNTSNQVETPNYPTEKGFDSGIYTLI